MLKTYLFILVDTNNYASMTYVRTRRDNLLSRGKITSRLHNKELLD